MTLLSLETRHWRWSDSAAWCHGYCCFQFKEKQQTSYPISTLRVLCKGLTQMNESKAEVLNESAGNGVLERFFKIKQHGSSVKNELIGGVNDLCYHGVHYLRQPKHYGGLWNGSRGGLCRHLYWCSDRLFTHGAVCELARWTRARYGT